MSEQLQGGFDVFDGGRDLIVVAVVVVARGRRQHHRAKRRGARGSGNEQWM